uniref:Putative reverse transcriptase-rnase h-integrase n=1 Tax=Moniliophthora roreri TaxID=221103 RepID=A0A0W0FND9_MONRR
MNIRVEEEEEVKKEEVEVEERYQRIMGNHQQRRKWWKEGILEDTTDELWVAARVTYSAEPAYKELKKKEKQSMEEIMPIEFHEYRKVFSKEESHRLPEHKPYSHAIDLKPDTPETIRFKVYPMSVNEQGELDQFLEENLQKGYIVPSKSPIASPVFFVKKEDGKLRFVQDYHKLNEFTVKNRYLLPLASDIICYVTCAATTTTQQHSTFQALMNSIFTDLIAQRKVAMYLDDILIYSTSLEEHHRTMHEVLKWLQENDLYLCPEKCEFDQEQVEYLGMVICKGVVSMDPVKVRAVKEWATPRNLREFQGFLGFANFY